MPHSVVRALQQLVLRCRFEALGAGLVSKASNAALAILLAATAAAPICFAEIAPAADVAAP